MERLNGDGNCRTEQSDKYFGQSVATTVVRKMTHSNCQRLSTGSENPSRSIPSLEQNHKSLLDRDTFDQQQHQTTMRINSTTNQLQTNYSEQQSLLTSADIEAMTMKQFRMGSIGC